MVATTPASKFKNLIYIRMKYRYNLTLVDGKIEMPVYMDSCSAVMAVAS